MTNVPKRHISKLEHRILTALIFAFVLYAAVLVTTNYIYSYNEHVRMEQEDINSSLGGEPPIRFSGGSVYPSTVPGLYAVSLLILIAIFFGRTFVTSFFLTLAQILLVMFAIHLRSLNFREPSYPIKSYFDMWLSNTLNIDFIALIVLPTLLLWQLTILLRIYGRERLPALR